MVSVALVVLCVALAYVIAIVGAVWSINTKRFRYGALALVDVCALALVVAKLMGRISQ